MENFSKTKKIIFFLNLFFISFFVFALIKASYNCTYSCINTCTLREICRNSSCSNDDTITDYNCCNIDGWYDVGSEYSCCDGSKICTCVEQEYRSNGRCSRGKCVYNITDHRIFKKDCTCSEEICTAVCSTGQVQYQECGFCGFQTRNCNTTTCLWNAWSDCTNQRACLPGSGQSCNSENGIQKCQGNCWWGQCVWAGPDKSVYSGGQVVLEGSVFPPLNEDSSAINLNWSCSLGTVSPFNIAQPTYFAPLIESDTTSICDLTVENYKDVDLIVGTNISFLSFENTGNKKTSSWTRKNVWDFKPEKFRYIPAFADLDGNGYYDILIGGTSGIIMAYKNMGSFTAEPPDSSWNPPFFEDYSAPSLADLDNDGDYDLLIGKSDGTLSAYENTGSKSSPSWTRKQNWEKDSSNNIIDVGSYSAPSLADLDNDWNRISDATNISITKKYRLTVNKVGNGTVTGPGINCGNDCTEEYPYNTSVILQAFPDSGYIFVGWSGDCSGTGNCNLIMDSEKTVTASFALPLSKPTNLPVVTDYCSVDNGFKIIFYWEFAEPQKNFQLLVATDPSFNSLKIDTCSPDSNLSGGVDTCNSIYTSKSYGPSINPLNWNTTYYWKVRVKNEADTWSDYSNYTSFKTALHDYPFLNFNWIPFYPFSGGEVIFMDNSLCYGTSGSYSCKTGDVNIEYDWNFGDGHHSSQKGNVTHTYSSNGAYSVVLKITDKTISPFAFCTLTRTLNVFLPPPGVIER